MHRQAFDPFASQMMGVAVQQFWHSLDTCEQGERALLTTQQVPGERSSPPTGAARIAHDADQISGFFAIHVTEEVRFEAAHGRTKILGNPAKSRHNTAALTSA